MRKSMYERVRNINYPAYTVVRFVIHFHCYFAIYWSFEQKIVIHNWRKLSDAPRKINQTLH